jgi:hypothetical protein
MTGICRPECGLLSRRRHGGFWCWVAPPSMGLRPSTARALQAQYRLTPLSVWGQEDIVVPIRRDV